MVCRRIRQLSPEQTQRPGRGTKAREGHRLWSRRRGARVGRGTMEEDTGVYPTGVFQV